MNHIDDTTTVDDTTEAWENGALGRDPEFAQPLDEATWAKERADIDESLGLKAISIRLEKDLIDDFRKIAKLNGMGYQPLMRQALKRFADCEKKRILTEAYNARVAEEREAPPPEDVPRKAA